MEKVRMLELLDERLLDLGFATVSEPERYLTRELYYVRAFCGLDLAAELSDEQTLAAIELTAADYLAEEALRCDKGDELVKSIRMGDLSVQQGKTTAEVYKELSERIYRRAIAVLAKKRGVAW